MFAHDTCARLPKLLLVFIASAITLLAQGKSYHIALPQYKANAGKYLTVPVILHDAGGLARIRIQINFNQEVITFASVQTGELGEHFDFDYEADTNNITLDFSRAENLEIGSGHLAHIRFVANTGASSDLYSDLAIAAFEIGDESGVTDLMTENVIILENGSVHVSLDPDLDNESNGLPDWWEAAHSLDPFRTSAESDEDNDSIINKFELAFGGDPNSKDNLSILPFGAVSNFQDETYFTLQFRRRTDESDGLHFQLYESADLVSWSPRAIDLLKIRTIDLGNGMELITVRGTNPMTGTNSEPKCFLKLGIE